MESRFELERDAWGKLVLTDAAGMRHVGVSAVRAFPIAAPDQGISLVTGDGKEVVWLDRLDDLPAPQRALVEEELQSREFMPEIRAIRSVSTYATPSTWQVATDRGDTSLTLRGEEDIRRITHTTLLISDSHGIHFLIRDLSALDRQSRKILDRFL
ncbi:cyanophycin metabolism-associated DUF1854 family protein [Noviherbaspirillum pedocola]|uniref:DUF1854 domain-containing protein n=1 Tax=Noviherbaspirillum pedocola TaxID=2801341 RepID=A0A934STY8_9BURK|nr:DUF1854 domain-containing protein [Noviherbaspirillum pedocola]MBK4735652.1 DUF1854 domain-containing protein [Noviherbaspirillum pedocola]